jgi:acyl-CoA synthetase (AMP-forming)/AMP-acid ligase II
MAPTKFVRDHELTMWFSVPSTVGRMRSLRMLPPKCFPSLRASLFCGEPLPADSAAAWAAAAPDSLVENLYGPTEATIAITCYRWGEASEQECVNGIVPIGKAFEGQRACVIDAGGHEAANDAEGELCLAGSQVTDGYLNNSEKTASQFVRLPLDPNVTWYRTGDLARRSETGCLFYLGRIDHQIKIRGFRVELEEIEHVLREAAGGGTAVAVPWPVVHGSAEGIVGFLSKVDGLATEPLLARCRAALPDYMVPNSIRIVQDLPLTSNGKIDRKQLIQQLEES